MGVGIAPTLTASHATSPGAYFLPKQRRALTLSAMCKLQGARLDRFSTWQPPARDMGHIVGNAMSVNVVRELFRAMLPTIGL